MSNFQASAGNQVGAAAQGASASLSLEALLSQLGDTQRAVLTQAQVLGKTAGDWLASAVMGPGFIIPQTEANLILAEATNPANPIQVAIKANTQDPNYPVNLEYAIASFACNCVGKSKSDIADQINWQVNQTSPGTNFAGMAKQHVKDISESIQLTDSIEASIQKLLFSGGDTATSRLNLNRYKARIFYNEAVDFNFTVLSDYTRFTILYDKLSREVKGLNKTTDLNQWRLQEGDTSSFSREQKNLTDHIRAIESQIKRHYHTSQAMVTMERGDKDSSERDTTFIIPTGVEKGRGEEAGLSALRYLKARIVQNFFWIAFPYVYRVVKDYHKGQFWTPPTKADGYATVPEWHRSEYSEASQHIWDALNTKANKDLMVKIQTPLNLGYHGKTNVSCMEGDGVSALYAIMMHYRPCNSVHVRSLKHTMSNAYLLFRKGDPEQVCNNLAHTIKECITLGVRLDWDITGQRITEIMSTRGDYGLYINKFMDGGDDPEDCAPTLQALMAEIVKVSRYHSEGVVNPSNKLIAHEMEFVFKSDEYGGKILPVEDRHAHETHTAQTPPNGGGADVSNPDLNGHGVNGEFSLENFTDGQLVAFMANRSNRQNSFRKGGKGQDGGKGGKYGWKGAPRRVPSNIGEDSNPNNNPNRRIPPPIDPTACNGKGCTNPPNAPYRFCDTCHQHGQRIGYIECKDGFKARVAVAKPQKRAFEAYAEEEPEVLPLPWYEAIEPEGEALVAFNASIEETPLAIALPEVTGPLESPPGPYNQAYNTQYGNPYSPKRVAAGGWNGAQRSPAQQMALQVQQASIGAQGLAQDRERALWGFNQS